MGERVGALARLVWALVYGVILYALGLVAGVVWILQFFYVLIFGRRHYGLADFYNKYVGFYYRIGRYLGFVTNKRPGVFEFEEIEPVDMGDDDKNHVSGFEEL